MTLDFLILGPFQVIDDQPLALGGPRQRAVLALLLLNRGEVITADRMIDELWGEHPPPTVAKAIHVYISNLRKAVGEGVLLTSEGGYMLAVEPNQVDAERFDGSVARGRTALERGYPLVARQRLREALSLWRGRPLADFSYHQFAQPEIARLEEARVAALEDRMEAELALGEHAALVPELETHVRAHPARERLWSQLMVALYRCGRQADALERYRRARRILIDEFGIEPGRDLKQTERGILTQDPALDAPARATATEREPVALTTKAPESPQSAVGEGHDDSATKTDDSAEQPEDAPPGSEGRGRAPTVPQRVADLTRPATVLARLADLRGAVDARWQERRLVIGVGAALLLIAVVVVAVLTSVGGSHSRPPPPTAAAGCSHCVASISSPRRGGVYTVGQSVPTSFSCSAGSGGQVLASCDDSTGTDTKSGGHGRLDTSTPGPHTYAVRMTVKGRATKTVTISYTVVAPLATDIRTMTATVSHRHARISLGCSGGRPGATCRGRVELKLRRLTLGHLRLATIGRAPYAVSADRSRTVTMMLTHVGMRALRHAPGHHRRVQLTVSLSGTSPTKRTIRLQLS